MTAEVAVMNKSAVALAADSAMTLTVGEARKTYPTNKLFALSKHHPIGIMIYNNADFMDVPWETIVKMYRQQLGASSKPTVKDYAEDFLGYVGTSSICTDEQRRDNLLGIASDLLVRIAKEVRAITNNHLPNGSPDVMHVIRDVVSRHSNALVDAGEAMSMQSIDTAALVRAHTDEIDAQIDQYFVPHMNPSLRQSFVDVLAVALKSSSLSADFSGIVFAGFGDHEIFPSLVEIVTDGAVPGVVKADVRIAHDLARVGTQTAIVPFAQSEMVQRFMNGIDPDFLRYMNAVVTDVLTDVYQELLTSVSPEPLADEQLGNIQTLVESKVRQFRERSDMLRRDGYVNPILEIVRYLPKEELASMAEALVSLTSLKRRVSTEEESVGGPVDVAVVSKGDGFIWIKRKHYFEPSLNPDYFVRQSTAPNTTPGGKDAL